VRDIIVHPEVADALEQGRPIVALESAVITAGLPTAPHKLAKAAGVDDWNEDEPTNLEVARAMSRAVREGGAVPAITAILDGSVHIGLPETKFHDLVAKAGGAKATVRDFAVLIATHGSAGTTVAGTLRACKLLGESDIQVMATGGIGGAHHTWPNHPDVSADLAELACTPMCVVCSGAKSVLNLAATLEMLETLSVPVIGFGTEKLPAFYLREHDNLRCQARVDSINDIAALCNAHWNTVCSDSSVIIAQPVHAEIALDPAAFTAALEEAQRIADTTSTTGADVTPILLREVAARTAGKSLDANISLLVNNARLAGQIAIRLNET